MGVKPKLFSTHFFPPASDLTLSLLKKIQGPGSGFFAFNHAPPTLPLWATGRTWNLHICIITILGPTKKRQPILDSRLYCINLTGVFFWSLCSNFSIYTILTILRASPSPHINTLIRLSNHQSNVAITVFLAFGNFIFILRTRKA